MSNTAQPRPLPSHYQTDAARPSIGQPIGHLGRQWPVKFDGRSARHASGRILVSHNENGGTETDFECLSQRSLLKKCIFRFLWRRFAVRCSPDREKIITSEREARSEFLLIYTKNLSMSGPPARRPAGRPAGRGYAFERLISLEP